MPGILFVCTGNTCRSSMAAAIAAKLAKERGLDVTISSAGLAAREGDPATPEAWLRWAWTLAAIAPGS